MDNKHGTSSQNQDKERIPDKESNDCNTVETGAPQQKEMNKQPEEIQKKRKLSESDDTFDGNVVKRPALLAVKQEDTDESAVEVPPTTSKNNADDDQNGGGVEREMTGNTMEDSHKDDEVITLSDDEDYEQTVKNPQKGEEEVQEEDSRAESNSSVSDEADTSGFSDKSFVMPPIWNTVFDNYCDQLIELEKTDIADFFDNVKEGIVKLKNGELQIEADHFVESKIRLLQNAENVYHNLRWKKYLMLSEAMKRNREWNIPAYLLSQLDDESADLIFLEEFIISRVPPTTSKNNADDDQNGGGVEREMTGNTMGDSHKDDEVITLSDDEDHEQTVKNPQKGMTLNKNKPVIEKKEFFKGEEEVQEEDSRAKSNSSVSDEADTSGFSDKSFVMPPVWDAMFNKYRDQLIEQKTTDIPNFFDYVKEGIVDLKNGELQIKADQFVERKIRLLQNAENVYDNLRWKRYLLLSESMKRHSEWNIPAYLLSQLAESPDLILLEECIITKEILPVEKETSSSEKSPDVITLDDDSDDIVPEEGSSFKDDVVVSIKGTKDQKSDSDGEKRLRSLKKATYTFEDDVYSSLIKISKLACDSLAKGDKDKTKKLEEDVSNQLRRFKEDIEQKTYTEILENANAFAVEQINELLLSEEMGDNELFEAYLARAGNITNVTFCIYMCWIQSQRAFDWFRALDLVVMRMTVKKPRLE